MTGILAQGVTIVTIAAGAIIARTESLRKKREEEAMIREQMQIASQASS